MIRNMSIYFFFICKLYVQNTTIEELFIYMFLVLCASYTNTTMLRTFRSVFILHFY